MVLAVSSKFFSFGLFNSVQFSHSVVSNSLRRHGLQQARLPFHHQPPEFTQTHLHWVGDATEPSHPLSSPSPPTFNLSQHQSFPMSQFFASGDQDIDWSFSFSFSPSNEYSGLISFRIEWFDLLAIQKTLKSSPTPQFKSINSSALSFLHSPSLTSVCDHWKNHSLD